MRTVLFRVILIFVFIVGIMVSILALAFLIMGVSLEIQNKEDRFSKINVGETFYHSMDGYNEKLPNNYCLEVNLGTIARLYQVPDELLNISFDGDENHDAAYLTESVIEGHYIKSYFNDEYIILCEEKEDNSLVYLSFEFLTQKVEHYNSVNEAYEKFDFSSSEWSSVCNTNEERQSR